MCAAQSMYGTKLKPMMTEMLTTTMMNWQVMGRGDFGWTRAVRASAVPVGTVWTGMREIAGERGYAGRNATSRSAAHRLLRGLHTGVSGGAAHLERPLRARALVPLGPVDEDVRQPASARTSNGE